MSKLTGRIAALGAVLLTGLTLTACGGIPGDAVVSVNGTAVTKSAFSHWLRIAASSSTTTTTGSVSKPVVPEPPAYTACIEHLEKTASAPAKGHSKPSRASLKSQCELQYTSLKQQTLSFLISADWVLGEASSQGVKVSDDEVKKQFNQIKSEQFPTEAAFQKFLASSGYTVSDLLLRVKLDMLSSKIQKKIEKEGAEQADPEGSQGLLRTARVAVRPAGKAQHPDRPHQDAGSGRRSQEGNPVRPELRERRQEGLDRPGQQGCGGSAQRRDQGSGGEGAQRSGLQRQGGCAGRSDQDAVRLLRIRSEEDRSRQPAGAVEGAVHYLPATPRAEGGEGAHRIRQKIPQDVDGAHRMPRRILGDGL